MIPQQALDDARTAVETKKATYDASLHNARNLRASIQASQATMKLAGRQLRDAEIRAPFDGYVEKRLVNLGELVKAQMPVMAIVRLDPLKVIAEIPEKMAPWISDGRPVELRVDAYRDRTFSGKVTRISPAVNTATRAFPFEAIVPNADAVLKPGTFARVHVESGKVDEVLTLPYAALQYRYGVNRVFVVQGDRLAVRELQVGERLGDRIEVTSGVKAGERVAMTDVESLADGALVTVTDAAAERPAEGGSARMLSEFCVRRPVSATMLVMSLVVLGTFSFRGLGVDLFPKADPATVSVRCCCPAPAPTRCRRRWSSRWRRRSAACPGIDEIQSRIAEGRGHAHRALRARAGPQRRLQRRAREGGRARSAARRRRCCRRSSPRSIPTPTRCCRSSSRPPGMSLRTLTELADKQIARAIQTVNGVGEVSLSGGRAREVHVVVDIEKLNSYGLSMTEVRDAIVAENVEIPGGTVEQGKGQLLLRTLGRVDATANFNDIVVATKDGTPIRISDIGHAEDSFERPTSAVWMGEAPAVMLDVRRAMGENTVSVIEGVRERLAAVERSLPKTVKLTVVRDDSSFIYASISSLEEHLLFGALFATIVVMFFIRNLRAVIISALAIPASIISSFTLMSVMGFTLNNMTLLAITLAVGIVIDDAIVVLENIFRYIEEKNCSPYEAAIEGTREVALAVMATTLSLVVIFLPIAFMNGYAKRFINPFGWTMAFAIMVSMLVSFTLTPMLSSRFLKLSDAAADHKTKERGFFHWLDQWYTRQVNWALDHPTLIIAISVVTVLLTFPLNRMVGREFVPNEDMGDWTIHVDAPEGTSLEGTTEVSFKLLKEISGIEGVAQIEPSIGVTGMGASSPTHIHFLCQALPIENRKNTQAEIITEMRRRLAALPVVPSVDHLAERAGQRRGADRLPDLGQHPRSRSRADRRVLEAGARGGAAAAEPDRSQDQPQYLEP